MKASLNIPNRHHTPDKELLLKTGQKSVEEMARVATANMAWSAAQNWDKHPLTSGRFTRHRGQKVTRQMMQRSLPPQSTSTDSSLVSRLVEMWELLPEDIKCEKVEHIAKKKICLWANLDKL